MSIDKKLNLKAEKDTIHFKAGDLVAGPLAFGYIGLRVFSSVGRGIGQALWWTGGRCVEGVAPGLHRTSIVLGKRKSRLSARWLNKKFNTPFAASCVALPLIIANIGIPVAATAIALVAPFTSLVSAKLVYSSATAAKLVKFALPITYTMWNKSEGSRAHKWLNPVFVKTGEQLKRLDTFIEDKAPIYKRAKDLLKKAPLSEKENKLLKQSKMPKFLQKIPGMRRAGVLSHHFTETAYEVCGWHEPDMEFVTNAPEAKAGLAGVAYVGKSFSTAGARGQIVGESSRIYAARRFQPTELAV